MAKDRPLGARTFNNKPLQETHGLRQQRVRWVYLGWSFAYGVTDHQPSHGARREPRDGEVHDVVRLEEDGCWGAEV